MRRWSGYVPILSVIGIGTASWFVAVRVGVPVWVLTLPGCVGGYFVSRTLLRWVYSDDG